ncbi:3-hydroxyisobutyrate dehydrogenase [Sporothrix schenckii 1099-18]|uniref:3-hydroxyisobutyrate dehydrogenase n=1 Tax=Sporothrix schenckii 1099-18 TaxID=1397361 RepID=A0A0F2MFC2_SPOSC|nr:3-hydroxyisobutyrate dehydrogenase [Sporothrix schenckii 1099-18]KJR87774.1 3-hydroxyisobutyrate dehydrogenase [Sporothrix schenckii 1099-18]
MAQTIGFVGVGAMGKEMVINLAKKTPEGIKLYIHDVNEAAVQELVASFPERISAKASAKDVAQSSEIIFTMLPEGRHVRAVYLDGPTSILRADLAGKILLECSTIDTATSLDVLAALRAAHPTAAFYDAPVSGGVLGARNATLGIFVGASDGGDDPHWATLRALLGLLGRSVIACGGPSLGLVAKLSNNYLSGTIAIATAEAMNMGMRAGCNARVLARVIHAGSGQNHIADKFNPVPGISPDAPASHGYHGGFKVELMKKDMGLAVDMAKRVGAQMVLGDASMRTYAATSADPRCQSLDSRVVYRFIGGKEDWE